MKKTYLIILSLAIIVPQFLFAQQRNDTIVNLRQCVDFALRNQPVIRQASIDQEINERDIRIGLSAWLPQISSSGVYDHYFKGGPFIVPGSTFIIKDYSTLGLQANQVIYNNDVLEAAKAAKYSRQY